MNSHGSRISWNIVLSLVARCLVGWNLTWRLPEPQFKAFKHQQTNLMVKLTHHVKSSLGFYKTGSTNREGEFGQPCSRGQNKAVLLENLLDHLMRSTTYFPQ